MEQPCGISQNSQGFPQKKSLSMKNLRKYRDSAVEKAVTKINDTGEDTSSGYREN